jgi:plastocyanin
VRARHGLLALPALLASATAFGAVHSARSPVAIGVSEREFHITAFRKTVAPGPVRLNVENLGQDTHNLVIRGPRGYSHRGPDLAAGDRAVVAATLARPGTYTLLCTRANHESLGMKTRIVVRRPAARNRR